jgi:hypothetical protein
MSERRIEWRLLIGNRFTGLLVCPDPQWPNMWRIHYGGRISDVVNLTRAKDAAISWVRAEGQGGAKGVRWERRETPAEGSSVAPNERAATSPPDGAPPPVPAEALFREADNLERGRRR